MPLFAAFVRHGTATRLIQLSMNTLTKTISASLCAMFLSYPVHAQQEQSGSETDPVYLFNEICYTQVPSVHKIQGMALKFAWEPMGGEDLQRFTTIKTPTLLEGWDIRLEQRIYRLGVVQSEPSDTFIASFPELADATATSCTLVLDGRDDAQTILDRLNSMIGKAPSTQNIADEELLTTTWSGGNDSIKVFVFLKTDKLDRANLMNVTIVAVPE